MVSVKNHQIFSVFHIRRRVSSLLGMRHTDRAAVYLPSSGCVLPGWHCTAVRMRVPSRIFGEHRLCCHGVFFGWKKERKTTWNI